MYDKNKNDLYGETLLVFYGNYDFIHMMRKGISIKKAVEPSKLEEKKILNNEDEER